MTYRIESLKTNTVLAQGLDVSSPAIRLDEGKLVDKKDPHPKQLKPGASVLVRYPLIGRELFARVIREPEGEPEKEWTEEEVKARRKKGAKP